ncbi:MAG TPA: hypothetical protein VNM72_09100 [Blastocatellia bacterium]|nr:hypothetical protein [Blastocatellia bacterium]
MGLIKIRYVVRGSPVDRWKERRWHTLFRSRSDGYPPEILGLFYIPLPR